jgi:hypothetical protein
MQHKNTLNGTARMGAEGKQVKRKTVFLLALLAVLSGIAAAAYSYTGPQNRVSPPTTTCRVIYKFASGPNQGQFACSMPCGEPENYPAMCGSACSATGCSSSQETSSSPGKPLPPATVSGSATCASPGDNGWCKGGATLNLSASEPLSGYSITGIESTLGLLCSTSGSDVNCSWPFPQGSTSLNFWADSSYGDTSTMASALMMLDSMPPSLTLSIPTPDGSNGWFVTEPVSATASASDATSGLASVDINAAGTTFTASADGTYPLTAAATDKAGNSTTASGTIKIDTTPPALSVSVAPADGSDGWYRSPAVFTASASDASSGLAGVQYRLDGGAWQDGSTAGVSADGKHTIQFQTRDQAGNTSSSAPVTVQVDTTPPVAAVRMPAPDGQNGWYISPVTIMANCSDTVSGLASQGVSLDGSPWSPSLTIATDGNYTIHVQAQDNAGNSTSASQTVHVDTTAPAANLVVPAPDGKNGWYLAPVTVSAQGTDATSGVASQQVSLDGSNWSPSLSLPDGGVYTVQGRVVDNAGNVSTVSTTIHIDHTPPVLSAPTLLGTAGQAGWYTSGVQFTASATDATSGLASLLYSLDGGAWQAGPLTLTDGRHTVQVQATDQAGNASTATQTVNVDSLPPVSAFISPAEGSMAFAHGTNFLMSGQSTDATSGLTSAQISLDNGASWQPLPLNPDGTWSYTWDLRQASNGKHIILVQAADQAGNLEQTARITVVVANLGPSISITKSWWLYQTAEVKMAGGVLPISGARIVVSDGGTHTRTYNYSRSSLPSRFQWNGIWDNGTKAKPGKYQVAAAAWDMLGTDAHAVGTVHVPYPIPTPTLTATPSSTPTPTRMETPTQAPMHAPMKRTQPAPTPTPAAPVVRPAPLKAPRPARKTRPFWPAAALLALLAALASASLSDPCPRALRALGKTLEDLQSNSN